MTRFQDYNFPDNVKYIFLHPNSFYWVKESTAEQNGKKVLLLGFPDALTKNLDKDNVKLTFRSENLSLRENKPFLRLLTQNKLFDFIAPWKSDWKINAKLLNHDYSFIDQPYDHYIIKCFNFRNETEIDSILKSISELNGALEKLLEKDIFGDCKSCPDFLQSSITRRSKAFKSERN